MFWFYLPMSLYFEIIRFSGVLKIFHFEKKNSFSRYGRENMENNY